MKDFVLSYILIFFVGLILNEFDIKPASLLATAFATLITTIFMFTLIRIVFATKTIHFWYWLLRTLHLRKKAKGTLVRNKDGSVGVRIDKLDPGEAFDVDMVLIPMDEKNKKFMSKLKKKEDFTCGKCEQKKRGLKGEVIPEHFRTCPKTKEKKNVR